MNEIPITNEQRIKSIVVTVFPDDCAEDGYTLNQLFTYLQWHKEGENNNGRDYGKWREYINDTLGTDLYRSSYYISNPIEISLLSGTYIISSFVRINTLSNLSIIGNEDTTIIRFNKFDLNNEKPCEFYWGSRHSVGIDRIVAFLSPFSDEMQQSYEKANFLRLHNITFELEDGLWFPFKHVNESGTEEEIPIGTFITYANFHKVDIAHLNINLNNGELTLLDGDECDHLKVTGCFLSLDNWNDRTITLPNGTKWERRREQGANLNVRGNNKSVFIAGNTFIKHGNDEILTFLANSRKPDEQPLSLIHENITVIQNSFTYLDANPTLSFPTISELTPNLNLKRTESAEINLNDTDDFTQVVERPLHINDVLVSFVSYGGECHTYWKNVVFAMNTFNLRGPVKDTVLVDIFDSDEYENMTFANNQFYHTYIQSHQLPGNGDSGMYNYASEYVYTSSFYFNMKHNEIIPTDSAIANMNSNAVNFYGNSIIYSQRTRDYQSPKDENYKLAFEHSCFKIRGICVDIHNNTIDGTQAVVERLDGAAGIYGNANNPISILHCLPCEVPITSSVRLCNNQAKGYGVVVRCREQYIQNNFDAVISKLQHSDRGEYFL